MKAELVIRGGTVVTPAGRTGNDIAVSDGRIIGLLNRGEAVDAGAEIDAAGRHVLPGAIDVHSHHREPGFTHKEDIETATMAARRAA